MEVRMKKKGKEEEGQDERTLLFSGTGARPEDLEAGIYGNYTAPQDRLLSGYQDRELEKAGDSLNRTQRMALEAEQIGANVLIDLRRQREQIKLASRHLHDTDYDLDESNRIMRDMLRR